MRQKLIVVEGLSASGKTTAGNLLAKRLGAHFYKSPAKLFSDLRTAIDEKADITARFFFYLAGLIEASKEIEAIRETTPVVCDRYIDTTLCYHAAMGVHVDSLVINLDQVIVPADFVFLVTCDDKTRIDRLEQRGLTHNDKVERNSGVEERFLSEYRKRKLIEIDNSTTDRHKAVERMVQYVLATG